jgi:hypothetical protein
MDKANDFIKYADSEINITFTGYELEVIEIALINNMVDLWAKDKNTNTLHIQKILNKISKA